MTMLHPKLGRLCLRHPRAQDFHARLGCRDLLHLVDELLAHRLQRIIGH